MNEVNETQSALQRLGSWMRITWTWIFCGGRLHVKKELEKAASKGAALQIKNWLWLNKIKHYKNHWAAKDAVRMCDKRIADFDS